MRGHRLRAAYAQRTEARNRAFDAEEGFNALLMKLAGQLIVRFGSDVAEELGKKLIKEARRRINEEEVPF